MIKESGSQVIPFPGNPSAFYKPYCTDCPTRSKIWTLQDVNWLRKLRRECDSFEVRRVLYAACAELGISP
jgi:hypothetical protein